MDNSLIPGCWSPARITVSENGIPVNKNLQHNETLIIWGKEGNFQGFTRTIINDDSKKDPTQLLHFFLYYHITVVEKSNDKNNLSGSILYAVYRLSPGGISGNGPDSGNDGNPTSGCILAIQKQFHNSPTKKPPVNQATCPEKIILRLSPY